MRIRLFQRKQIAVIAAVDFLSLFLLNPQTDKHERPAWLHSCHAAGVWLVTNVSQHVAPSLLFSAESSIVWPLSHFRHAVIHVSLFLSNQVRVRVIKCGNEIRPPSTQIPFRLHLNMLVLLLYRFQRHSYSLHLYGLPHQASKYDLKESFYSNYSSHQKEMSFTPAKIEKSFDFWSQNIYWLFLLHSKVPSLVYSAELPVMWWWIKWALFTARHFIAGI